MNAKNLLVAALVAAAACSREKTEKTNETKAGVPPGASQSTPVPHEGTTPASYVGTHYDPMPVGVQYESGSVIIGRDGKPSHFVLSHVSTPGGLMLWIDEVLPDDGAIRRRVVLAAMADPPIQSTERRVIGTCGIDGKFNGDIVAVVKEVAGRRYTTVYRAWRAIPEAGRFDSIPVNGIVCEDPAT